jgi:predicted DNA-binding protein (MmcQ/YjbR family)
MSKIGERKARRALAYRLIEEGNVEQGNRMLIQIRSEIQPPRIDDAAKYSENKAKIYARRRWVKYLLDRDVNQKAIASMIDATYETVRNDVKAIRLEELKKH